MAQIKVLDLCDSHLLPELGYNDTQKVNGGGIGAIAGLGYSIYRRRDFETTLQNTANGAGGGGGIGGAIGGTIGFFAGGIGAGPGAVGGAVVGASLA